MSVIENKESLLSQEVEMDKKDDNFVFIPIEENNRLSSENNTNKYRRKSQTTKRTNGKKNSKCSIKCIIYSIILCCLIASIGYACFAIYNVLTKYSCNIFGISIARNENELKGLEKCKKLTKLTILGTEWSSIRFKNGMFNTVEELDVSQAQSIEEISIGSDCLQNLQSLHLSNLSKLKSLSIDNNSLSKLPVLSLMNLPSLQSLLIGENSLLVASAVITNTTVSTISIGKYSFQNSPSFELLSLPNLATFSIGEDVFLTLSQLIIYGIPSLQSVSIGSKSCPSCSFTVVENPRLRNIIIGEKAFMKGQLKVSELPALESIQLMGNNFNKQEELELINFPKLIDFTVEYSMFQNVRKLTMTNLGFDTYVFLRNTFEYVETLTISKWRNVKSIEFYLSAFPQVTSLTFQELPLLAQIKGHEKVFENVKSLELTNFPVLKTIEFMDYSFTNLEELTIRDNLALEKFAMGNNDPRVLKSIVLANLPSLSSFSINSDSKPETFTVTSLSFLNSVVIEDNVGNSITSFSLAGNGALQTISIGDKATKYSLVGVLLADFSGLSSLTSFIIGDHAFKSARRFVLSDSPLQVFQVGMECWQKSESISIPSKSLKTFSVGANSFSTVSSIDLEDCSALESFTIGNDSFKETKELSIKNAKALTHVAIGSNCFTEASIFNLENSSQLTYLHIDSNSFTNVTTVDLTEASKLSEFCIGNNSFQMTKSLTISSISLTIFMTGGYSFQYASLPSLSDCINLRSFTIGDYSFIPTTTPLVFENFHELTTIEIGKSSLQQSTAFKLNGSDCPVVSSIFMHGDNFNGESEFDIKDVEQLMSLIIVGGEEESFKKTKFFQIDEETSFRNSIRQLVIGNNVFTALKELYITDAPVLEKLLFGNKVGQECNELVLKNVNELRQLEFGESAFTTIQSFTTAEIPNIISLMFKPHSFKNTKELIIQNALHLSTLKIDNDCFAAGSKFILENVPELVNFSIGAGIAKSEEETCFANVESVAFANLPKIHNFSVSGIAFPNAKNVTISKLSLPKLAFGDNVFSRCKYFVLEELNIMNTLSFGMSSFHDLTTLSLTDFTSLTTIELKSHSFASLKQFTMKNLPKVQTILAEDYTCYHVEEFEIAYMPTFQGIVTGNSAFYSTKLILRDLQAFNSFDHFNSSDYNFLGGLTIYNCSALTHIALADGVLRTPQTIQLKDLINLESIEVGYDCFSNVNLIEFSNLPKLTSIISHNQIQSSFLPSLSSSSSSSSYGGTFLLESLPLLHTVHLEGNSFDLFDTMILQNLPQLQQFFINGTGDNALSKLQFINLPLLSSVSLSGSRLENLYTLTFTNTSIQSLYIGSRTFMKRQDFALENIPTLSNLIFEKGSLQKITALNLTNLPSLSSISWGSSHLDTLRLENLPYNNFTSVSSAFGSLSSLILINSPIEKLAFSNYSFTFLKSFTCQDMTQLKAIEFGPSSFGMCDEVNLINLPALETVITSDGKRDPYVSANFRYMKNVVFRDLPQLKEIVIGSVDYDAAVTLLLEQLPELTTVSVHDDALMSLVSMNVTALPKLNTIDIAGTAMSKLTTMNYAGISQSLYNQFCTKPEFTCNEQ